MYSTSKLIILCFAVLLVRTTFAQDTLFVNQLSYIDSSTFSFQMGVRPLVVDNSNIASFFYTSRGDNTDFIYVTTLNYSDQNWSTPEVVSTHEHPTNNRYYAQGPTVAIDKSGYAHVVYPYRGTPIYAPSWSNYPPSHINYVTNESGEWVTFVDVINDSTVQASEGNGVTVSYLHWPTILSLNNLEYFAAFDYAWWATKSHVVYSERGANGIWSGGSALVTYERGSIDKYTINTSTMVTDATNIYSLWFNRFTGELKSKTNSAGVWGEDETIFTSPYAIDGVVNAYSMSSISGNGKSQVVMSRMENTYNYNELIFAENNGSSWSVQSIQITDSLNLINAYEKNDTTNIFYRYYKQSENSYGYKYLTHTNNGFSEPAVVSFGEHNNVYNFITAEHRNDPLIYQYYDKDKEMWYLCSGEFGNLVITSIEESNNNIQTGYSLKQNYPNPFNPSTTIEFSIPITKSNLVNGATTIKVYDIVGSEVKTLYNGVIKSGRYKLNFDGSNLPSGIYFIQMRNGQFRESIKTVLLK